jgi:hypothetical protein
VSAELDLAQQPFVISPADMSGLREGAVPTGISSTINPVTDFTDFLEDS